MDTPTATTHKGMFMSKFFQFMALIGALAVFGYGDDSISISTKSETAMQTLERIMAKAGISFDGEFRSQFQTAGATGAAVNMKKRYFETVEYTSVDFDIKARPNTLTQGRLIFRMQQDWRNFYSDISNPIFSRWISIDGSLKGMFSYNIGDFRQKFTPLTLYSPDFDILFEPDIFAQERMAAQNEVFVGDNQRLFQGVNLNFGAEVYPIFNSLKVGVLGTRLRNVETSIQNGNKVTALIEASPVEKFMGGTNADLTFLKGVSLGGSFLNIFDNKGSYSGPGGDTVMDTMAQNTTIGDFRVGLDIGSLLDGKDWSLGVSAEMAFSADDSSFYDTNGHGSGAALRPSSEAITGAAIRAGLKANYGIPDLFSVVLDVVYLNNTADFRNELAQTPSFIGRRIMNVENDGMSSKVSYPLPLYSTFDALYHQVFKFAPSINNPGWWYQEPFSKNSYNPMVMTQTELGTMNYKYFQSPYLDPSVQLIMPFGPATPNRSGFDAHATLGFIKDRLQAKVLFASLKEVEETNIPATVTSPAKIIPKTSFSQAGGGVKAELDKFLQWQYPINLSLSAVQSKANNDGIVGDTSYPAASITSGFFAGNLYLKFWKRMALLSGVEYITNDFTTGATFAQKQLLAAIGLEYKVSEGSSVTATYGQIDVKHSGSPTVIVSNKTTGNHNQKLVNVLLRVLF
jgi:hypothetical protein